MIDIILTVGTFAYLTNNQTPHTAKIISSSSVLFTLSYGILRQTRYLHPKPPLEPHVEAEWRSRIIGAVHAVILSIGSILCFLEWSDPNLSKDLNDTWHWHVEVRTPETERMYVILFASIFLGYLQYDMLWLIYHRKTNFDAGSMVHHCLFIAISHYVLHGYYFSRPFAWLSFCEISTPFMHFRWFYIVTNKKDSAWYMVWSILFLVTFLLSRVVCYGWGLSDLWHSRDFWSHLPYGLYAVIAGVHLGYLLNLFWAHKVVSALIRLLKRKKMQKDESGPLQKESAR